MVKFTYYRPNIEIDKLALTMLNENHCLIAGATGSGKSTMLDTLLTTLCFFGRYERSFGVIDLKRVSVARWRNVPHCERYVSEPYDAMSYLRDVNAMMDQRYRLMEQYGVSNYDGTDFYLVVDECADLLDSVKGSYEHLKRIARLGRAAKIHLVLCTQDPSRKCLEHALIQNINARLALRCVSPIESRQIVGVSGAEKLPRYGEGLFWSPDYMQPSIVKVNLTSPETIQYIIDWWKDPAHAVEEFDTPTTAEESPVPAVMKATVQCHNDATPIIETQMSNHKSSAIGMTSIICSLIGIFLPPAALCGFIVGIMAIVKGEKGLPAIIGILLSLFWVILAFGFLAYDCLH